MSWSKLKIIGEALTEIGLGDYIFDATPNQKQGALARLDALMARWEDDGIVTGYAVEDNPDDDTINEDSGIYQQYVRGVILNLAVEVAPSYGKQAMAQTVKAAAESKTRAMGGQTPPIKAINTTSVPAGAGYRYYADDINTLPETEY